MAIKRRDLIEASRLLIKAGLARPGEMDTPSLMLAVNYIGEKRDGTTDLTFDEWLDGDFSEDDLDDKSEGPTEPEPPKKAAPKRRTSTRS